MCAYINLVFVQVYKKKSMDLFIHRSSSSLNQNLSVFFVVHIFAFFKVHLRQNVHFLLPSILFKSDLVCENLSFV